MKYVYALINYSLIISRLLAWVGSGLKIAVSLVFPSQVGFFKTTQGAIVDAFPSQIKDHSRRSIAS